VIVTRDRRRSVRKLDAPGLRALAHPLRLRLLGMLAADGPATATKLGSRVGESSGTTSWHLRLLAEQGLIEEDPERGNRRERWWRAAQDRLQVTWADFAADPDHAQAMRVYVHEVLAMDFHRASTFLAGSGDWPPEWRRACDVSHLQLRLTAAELQALNTELLALVQRYDRPGLPGDETVVVQWQSFPRRPEPPEVDR
jgi:DNA-binding transcriptional ArsR family regulator